MMRDENHDYYDNSTDSDNHYNHQSIDDDTESIRYDMIQ